MSKRSKTSTGVSPLLFDPSDLPLPSKASSDLAIKGENGQPIVWLDELLGGSLVQPDDPRLVLVSGGPGLGKSLLVQQLCLAAYQNDQLTSVIVTAESRAKSIITNLEDLQCSSKGLHPFDVSVDGLGDGKFSDWLLRDLFKKKPSLGGAGDHPIAGLTHEEPGDLSRSWHVDSVSLEENEGKLEIAIDVLLEQKPNETQRETVWKEVRAQAEEKIRTQGILRPGVQVVSTHQALGETHRSQAIHGVANALLRGQVAVRLSILVPDEPRDAGLNTESRPFSLPLTMSGLAYFVLDGVNVGTSKGDLATLFHLIEKDRAGEDAQTKAGAYIFSYDIGSTRGVSDPPPLAYEADIWIRLDTSEEHGYVDRHLEIVKARYQNHSRGRHRYKIHALEKEGDKEKNTERDGPKPVLRHGGMFVYPNPYFVLSKLRDGKRIVGTRERNAWESNDPSPPLKFLRWGVDDSRPEARVVFEEFSTARELSRWPLAYMSRMIRSSPDERANDPTDSSPYPLAIGLVGERGIGKTHIVNEVILSRLARKENVLLIAFSGGRTRSRERSDPNASARTIKVHEETISALLRKELGSPGPEALQALLASLVPNVSREIRSRALSSLQAKEYSHDGHLIQAYMQRLKVIYQSVRNDSPDEVLHRLLYWLYVWQPRTVIVQGVDQWESLFPRLAGSSWFLPSLMETFVSHGVDSWFLGVRDERGGLERTGLEAHCDVLLEMSRVRLPLLQSRPLAECFRPIGAPQNKESWVGFDTSSSDGSPGIWFSESALTEERGQEQSQNWSPNLHREATTGAATTTSRYLPILRLVRTSFRGAQGGIAIVARAKSTAGLTRPFLIPVAGQLRSEIEDQLFGKTPPDGRGP